MLYAAKLVLKDDVSSFFLKASSYYKKQQQPIDVELFPTVRVRYVKRNLKESCICFLHIHDGVCVFMRIIAQHFDFTEQKLLIYNIHAYQISCYKLSIPLEKSRMYLKFHSIQCDKEKTEYTTKMRNLSNNF